MLRIIKIVIVLIFFGFSLTAQQVDKHSLAMGFHSGNLKLYVTNKIELNSSSVGLNLNHQVNPSPWFSWRTGFNALYLTPVNYYKAYSTPVVTNPIIPYRVGEEDTHQHWLLNLDLMPTFYYRDDGFKLFAGLSGTAGADIHKIEIMKTQLRNQQEYDEELEPQKETYLQIGWGPVGGVAFDLGGKRKGGEIELAFSYRNYYTLQNGKVDKTMAGFGILTSYRYYFKY